jgi:peroxiredoxin
MSDKDYEVLAKGQSLRFFDLPEARGSQIRLWDYRGRRNLVIFFMDDVECSYCRKLLRMLSATYNDITAEEAEVLAVVQAPPSKTVSLKHELGLPYPVLSDASGEVFRRYGLLDADKKPQVAIVIADRFGEVYHVSLVAKKHSLLSAEEILSWLKFIEVQCPECGAPEWPG